MEWPEHVVLKARVRRYRMDSSCLPVLVVDFEYLSGKYAEGHQFCRLEHPRSYGIWAVQLGPVISS